MIKEVSEKIENKTKEQKAGFFVMSLGILGASLLGNMLAAKTVIQPGEETIRSGFLITPDSLANFEIPKYYQSKLKFNDVYSRNNLPKIKDETHVVHLNESRSIGTQWVALYVNGYNVTYFDSFGVEHIPKEIKKIHRQQKYHNKYLYNTSKGFNNVWILLY